MNCGPDILVAATKTDAARRSVIPARPAMAATLAAALAFGLALPADAENGPDSITELDAILVQASRPLMFDSRLATVSKIDEETFQEINPFTLPDILRFAPGVSVSTYGGMGQPASISIRGTSGAQAPMFLNGLRISSSSAGLAPWSLIPPDFIEQADIYRGPAATIFGADAIGGAVQLFTPSAFGERRSRIEVGGGTQDTGFALLSTRQQIGDWSLFGGANYYSTQGQDTTRPGAYGHEPGADGYEAGSFLASAARQIGDQGVFNLFALTLPALTQYDATPDQPNRNRSLVSAYGVNLRGEFNEGYDYTATLGATQDQAHFSRPGTGIPADTFSTWRYQGTGAITQRLHWTDVQVTNKIGVEVTQEELNATTHYQEGGRTTAGLSANSTIDIGNHALLLAARGDQFSPTVEESFVPTWNLGYSYRFNRILRGRLNYGTAYRLPSFNDLYYPLFGNPNLKPEHSRQGELALDAQFTPHLSSTLAVYQNNVDDLIQFSTQTWLPENIASARLRGIEFTTRWRASPASDIQGQISYNTPEDLELGQDLRRRPRLASSVTLSQAWNDSLRTSLFVNYVGKSYEDAANTQRLQAYTLLGLNASYSFGPGFIARLTANNLLNQQYETVLGYPALGRAIYASIGYQF